MAKAKLGYGHGTGIPAPIDVHVGARLRVRRKLLGCTTIGDTFDIGKAGELTPSRAGWTIIKRILLAALLAAGLATPAFAFQCEDDMLAVDAALAKSPRLSASLLAEVKTLRAKGEWQHSSGQHGGAIRTLAKAKEILGIK